MIRQYQHRWHQRDFKNNLLKSAFLEWKYFNFSDKKIAGIIVMMQHDPLNLSHHSGASLIARFYEKNKIYGSARREAWDQASFSSFSPKAKITNSSLASRGSDMFLSGELDQVSWQLHFHPLEKTLIGFENLKLDILNLEKAWWQITMPKARVTGTVIINNKSFEIDCLGYHDANWGQIMPLASKINWLQYNDRQINIVVGETDSLEIAGEKIGRWAKIFVNLQGKRISFKADDFSFKSSNKRLVASTNYKVARLTTIEANNGDYKLEIKAQPLIVDPIRFKMPYGLPLESIIAEQPSQIEGKLYRRNNKAWQAIHKFKGQGFIENTLRGVTIGNSKPKIGILI